MNCRSWSETLIATIYDDCSSEEAHEFAVHVADCAQCRETVEQLRSTRDLLREHAPEILEPRPLLVLGTNTRRWHPAWAFAAGLGAAAVLFGAGIWVARPDPGFDSVTTRPDSHEVAAVSPSPAQPAFRAEESDTLLQILARLDRIEAGVGATAATVESVHPESLRVELDRLERRIRRQYRTELEQLAVAFAASERRTDEWLDDARDAIHLLALRQDSRLTER